MGEEWSPNTEPDKTAAKKSDVWESNSNAIWRAIGIIIANVPQLEPMEKAIKLESILKDYGFAQENKYYFDTLKIKANSEQIKKIAEKEKVNFFYVDQNTVSIALNETVTDKNIEKIVAIFKKSLRASFKPK